MPSILKILVLKCIVADSPSTKVSISSLLCRSDDHSLGAKVREVNKHLSSFASQNGWKFISHSNMTSVHLNSSGLHLNYQGSETLLKNFTKHIRHVVKLGLDWTHS